MTTDTLAQIIRQVDRAYDENTSAVLAEAILAHPDFKQELFCIVEDGDGHRWICPVEKREEVEASLESVIQYWEKGDYSKPCPENLTESLPEAEGQRFTFSNPHFNGKPL